MGDHRTPEERRADSFQESVDSAAFDTGRIADALESILLEMRCANAMHELQRAERKGAPDDAIAALDKKWKSLATNPDRL